jgi:hypothetical protein
MTEPFSNALNAIQNAFAMRDPTSKLLELIRAHPDLSTITVIVITYIDLAQQAPSLVDKLADTLVSLKETNITVRSGGRLGDTTQIARALDSELDEYLGSDLVAVKDASVSPSNEHLTTSLLCCNNREVFAL